jgi:hypothetical protein
LVQYTIIQPTNSLANKKRKKEEDSGTMKKIHLKRIMIESGEDYGLGFPASPKTPNTVSKLLYREKNISGPFFYL